MAVEDKLSLKMIIYTINKLQNILNELENSWKLEGNIILMKQQKT